MKTLMHRLALKRVLRNNPMAALSGITILITLGVAITDVLWSLMADSYTHDPALTGIVLSAFSVLAVVYYLFLSPVVDALGEKRSFVLSLLIAGVTAIILPFSPGLWPYMLVAAVSLVGYNLRNLSLGILVRDASTPDSIGRNEGLKFAVLNLGYVIAPLLVIWLFKGSDFRLSFIIAGLLMLVGAVLSMFFLRIKERRTHARHANPFSGFGTYWRDPERVRSYVMRTGLSVYWGFMFTYVPLMILYEGLPASTVGFVMFAVAVPLVILEYPLGKAINMLKYRGAFFWGFLIIAATFFAASIMPSTGMKYALLIASAIGAAFLEPATEAHFFAITKRDEEAEYFGTFFTSQHFGMLLARLAGAALIIVVGFESMLMPFGIIFLAFALTAMNVNR